MSASQRGKNPRILSNTIFFLSVTKDVFPLFSFRQAGKILTELACKTRAMPSELLGRVSLWSTSLSRNTCKLRGEKIHKLAQSWVSVCQWDRFTTLGSRKFKNFQVEILDF